MREIGEGTKIERRDIVEVYMLGGGETEFVIRLVALGHIKRPEHPISEREDEAHIAVQVPRLAAVMHLMHPGADENLAEQRAVGQGHM